MTQFILIMKYKKIARKKPNDPGAPAKFYIQPVNDGKVDKRMITDDLVLVSSLSRGDITSVIENLIDIMPKYLLMGKSVQLGELGTLRVSFSSEGADTIDELNPSMVRGKKIIFVPGKLLKELLPKLTFELVQE